MSRCICAHCSCFYRLQSRDAYFCTGCQAERCTISFFLLTPLWLKLRECSILPIPRELSETCARYAMLMRSCRRGGVLGARPLRGTEHYASPELDRKNNSSQQHTPAQERSIHASEPRSQAGCNTPRSLAGAPHMGLFREMQSARLTSPGRLGSAVCDIELPRQS